MLFNSLSVVSSADCLDPDQALQNVGLIWIQFVWHSDGISERSFWKGLFWKKSADDKNHENWTAFIHWFENVTGKCHVKADVLSSMNNGTDTLQYLISAHALL